MKLGKVLSVLTFIFLSSSANAISIVDTGVNPCNDNYCGGATLSSVVNPDDMWAARFNLGTDAVITDINVWVGTFFNIDTSFTMALYGDNLTIPDTSNELFSQDVFITDTGVEDNFNNQWQGLSGLDLALSAGSYWLSLELRDGNNYDGYIPTGEFGALNAIDTYAFYNPYNGIWLEDPSSDFAFQIMGEVSTVPVPAAAWLFGSFLIGFFSFTKRKSKA